MKLTVFGATGGVGQTLVVQALEQGHDVTAFARRPEKLGKFHDRLRVVEGDVLDPIRVRRAVEGQDGVLCALGMPLMNTDKLRARGTENIVRAMQEASVKRLVCLSSLGAGDSRGALPFHYRYFIIPLMMRHLLADHELQESHVRSSGLDWVIVRPGNFTKNAETGVYRHGFTAPDRSLKLKISRIDVAGFMLQQMVNDTYLHQSPGLSY